MPLPLTIGTGRALLGVQAAIAYLLLDRFTTAASAPLTSPRTCEPGPGTLTIVDTNNIVSISGGRLVINGTPAANDRVVSTSSYARLAGRALLISIPVRTAIASNPRFGWAPIASDSGSDTGIDYSNTTQFRIKVTSASIPDTITLGSSQHDFVFVMRGTGMFLFARNGGSGAYTLYWVDNTGTSSEFVKLPWMGGGAQNFTVDDVRVVDLGGLFATDYGFATDRKATSTAGDTITMTADAIVEHTLTAATGVTQDIQVRRVDDNNCWIIRCAAPGTDTIALIEKVAGVETSRSSVAQTWTNGVAARVVITCEGTTIKTYVANVAKNSYASASSNQTATLSKVDRAGVDFVSWPRTVSLPNV